MITIYISLIKDNSILCLLLVLLILATMYFIVYIKIIRNKKYGCVFYAENSKIKSFLRRIEAFVFIGLIFLITRIIENTTVSFMLCILLLFTLLGVSLFFLNPKMLVLKSGSIRCPLSWEFKWSDVKEWHIDKEKKTLFISTKNSNEYYFSSIKNDDMEILHDEIEQHLKLEQST